jgi:hypothetical protein
VDENNNDCEMERLLNEDLPEVASVSVSLLSSGERTEEHLSIVIHHLNRERKYCI